MAKEFYFYDSAGTRRRVKEFYFYDSANARRKVKEAYFYDAAGARRQFFASALNVLSATMTAGNSTNFNGYSASPASPTYGSCSPVMYVKDYRCCYMGSISTSAEIEVSLTGPTDPGQNFFTSWTDGLGGTRLASAAAYSYSTTTKIARWRFITAGVDYVAGNSYNVGFTL